MNVLLMTFNAKYVHTCLALYSLRAYVKEEDIEIREYTINMPLMDVLHEVYSLKPDHIMISTYIWNRTRTEAFVREASKILPNTTFYLGGPEATNDAKTFLDDYPEIKAIFCNESEETLAEVLPLLRSNRPLCNVPGLMVRSETYQPRPTMDITKLVFPYTDEELDHMSHKLVYYEASRGCPFSCSYCLSSLEKSLRIKPLELVKEEINRLVDKRVQTIKFVDRTFNIDPKRTKEILTFVQQMQDIETCFHFEVSADLFDESIFKLIETMPPGRIQFEIGLQSTNVKTLVLCRRKTDLERIERAILRLKNAHTSILHLDLIAGLPEEDDASFINSFEQAMGMRPHVLNLGFLKVLKGSPLHAEKVRFAIKHTDDPPYEVLETSALNFGSLGRFKKIETMIERYYNSQEFPLTLDILPFVHKDRVAGFYLGLADFERLGRPSGYQGLLGRYARLYLYCLDNKACFIGPWSEWVRDIVLFDALLNGQAKALLTLLASESQKNFPTTYQNHKISLSLMGKITGIESIKKTYKQTSMMIFKPSFINLIGEWLKTSGRFFEVNRDLAKDLRQALFGQEKAKDRQVVVLFDYHQAQPSLYKSRISVIY